MKKNFEDVKDKLNARALALYPGDKERRKEYVQAELKKIYYYDPMYEKAKAILMENAEILFPDRLSVFTVDGIEFNGRKTYIEHGLEKFMAQIPRVEDLKIRFSKEAALKYPWGKIKDGKFAAFDGYTDYVDKRLVTARRQEYIKIKLEAFDYYKGVELPKLVMNLEKARQDLEDEIKAQIVTDSDENIRETEASPLDGKKKRGRPPVKQAVAETPSQGGK